MFLFLTFDILQCTFIDSYRCRYFSREQNIDGYISPVGELYKRISIESDMDMFYEFLKFYLHCKLDLGTSNPQLELLTRVITQDGTCLLVMI